MFGKFLGKNQKPSLPKNQIEVVCPVCGAAQYEPRLVVTTVCKKCGEHLRIAGRKVVASSQINPVPSAVYPSEMSSTGRVFEQEEQKPGETPPPNALLPTEPTDAEVPLGLGNMMGIKDEEESPSHTQKPVMPEKANEAAPAQGPMAASTLQKMKDQGYYKQQYFKEVECFDCHHKFKVGRSAKSTQCPACGTQICLEDFDINLPSTIPILTRGDVLIRKNGNVNTSEIKCRDLKVFGSVSAQIECSGDLILKTAGTVIGEIRCARFVVEKGSDINFHNMIYADEVDVQARVFGNIQCSGKVNIGAQGWIHGDVTARSVSIEPGGQLDGAMNILRTTPQKPAAPAVKPMEPNAASIEDDIPPAEES